MVKKIGSVLLLFLLLSMVTACDEERAKKIIEFNKQMDTYIQTRLADKHTAGLSIAVVDDQGQIMCRGFGVANQAEQLPANGMTLYRMQSVSKMFTGVAVMQLVEKGKIDLDAPVRNYIDGFSTQDAVSADITVRDLLCHQSGFPREKLSGAQASDGFPAEDYHALIPYLQTTYLAYKPNYRTYYSNIAFSVLGILVEKVSGEDFCDYVHNHILQPTDMLTSDFKYRPGMEGLVSTYYQDAVDYQEVKLKDMRDIPAGDLFSSAIDMSFFLDMLLNNGAVPEGRILEAGSLEAMFEIQNSDLDIDLPFDGGQCVGLASFLSNPYLDYAGGYAGHLGGGEGFTALKMLTEHKIGVVVLANSSNALSAQDVEEISDEALIRALTIFKGIEQPPTPPMPPTEEITPEQIAEMSGTYAVSMFGDITIEAGNGGLVMKTAMGDFDLIRHTDGWYSIREANFPYKRVTVRPYKGQRVFFGEELRHTDCLRVSIGEEVLPLEDLSPSWLTRMGVYEKIDEENTSIPKILLSMDPQKKLFRLAIFVSSNDAVPPLLTVVEPFNNDVLTIKGHGTFGNEKVVFHMQGDQQLLSVDGYTFKKIN